MTSHSKLLERHKLQTFPLPPDRWMHILTEQQTGNGTAQVLYKKQLGNTGRLGGGSFGVVDLEIADSECEAAPRIRAVKSISKAIARENQVHWEQEVENLIALSKFPDFFVTIFGWWEDDRFIYLPMEYFEAGDLSRCKGSVHGEVDVRAISHQIALGLQSMHNLNIIHRDLKPQNVFVASRRPRWHVKIGDFGFSKRISESVSAPFSTRGTTKYMAPEYRDPWNDRETSDFTTAVDMWSFGCLVYELFAQKCPFEEDDTNSLKAYTRDKVFPRQPLDRAGASSESIWLITKLLEPDPDMRLTAQDALDSVWFSTSVAPQAPALNVQDDTAITHYHPPIKSEDSMPHTNSPEPPVARVESAPPELIVASYAAREGDDDTHLLPQLPPRPTLAERAAGVPAHPTGNPSGSLPALEVTPQPTVEVPRPALPPRLPPRPRSTSSLSTGIMDSVDAVHTDIVLKARRNSSTVVRKPDSIELPDQPSSGIASSKGSTPLAASLISTSYTGGHIDMHFKNLPFAKEPKPLCEVCEARRVFNPIIRPAALYYCKDCGHRPLCARCIVDKIRTTTDPHEADHKLRAYIQAHKFRVPDYFERYPLLATESAGGLPAGYGSSWLHSDHAFTAPIGGYLTTRWTMEASPGEYTVSIDIRTSTRHEEIKGSAIGSHRSMLIKAKVVQLGSILLGAQTLNRPNLVTKQGITAHGHYLPDGLLEHELKFTEEEQQQTLTMNSKVHVDAHQVLEVLIRGSYDALFFKAGCPFKWWLDQITITWMGPEDYVASMGDRKMRETFKAQQARLRREKNIEKSVRYLGQGLSVAAGFNKVRSASPSKKNNLMVSAVSLGLSHAASAMKSSRQDHNEHAAAAPTVYNQYFMSNDAVNFQQQPEYEFSGAEYEEPEEADFALEGGQGQLQIESGMDNTANSDWAYEQQQQ